ncbi:hypothetical protein [Bacteroides bouchesdurhonensis]|uniref:hypothetical protein n=1 Tax=Bacteroides bouchesdurhonensis TaxID=1841855 RepID=UPI00097F8A5C|nr:hypothetical protein [Bacteroides bouchesdurhonensis]
MVTIYLDKQLFSHLFKAEEKKYSVLREKILSHKDEFIFFYSDAHLHDLQQDTTDIKYEEMDFSQIKADNWSRVLLLNDAEMCLTKFQKVPMLCFWIKPKTISSITS